MEVYDTMKDKAKQELANVSPSLSESDRDEQPGTASQHGDGNRQFNNFGTGPQKNVDSNYLRQRAIRISSRKSSIFMQKSGALWGLGGSGKTQVALECAYRRSRDPACSVFWVHADNETTFTQDYKAIAKRLGLAGGLDGPELLTAVRERIEAGSCWLLILDNMDNLGAFGVGRTQSGKDQGWDVEEKHSLYDFVPRGSAGTVLWTSRDKRIGGSLVGAKRAINVARMTDAEAMALLETVGNREIGEGELDGAAQLLAELDWLPLAVSQAATYMRRISMEQIRQENEMAYDILHVLAFLDSQNIPLEIMIQASALQDDDDEVLYAAILLQEFSFLHLRASEGGHPIRLSRRDRRENEVHFSKLALRVVTDLFPELRRELWGECEKYVVHAQRAGEWAELCEGEIEASGLLSRVSDYMFDRGRWREKEPVDKRAYEFRRKRLGEKHLDTIRSMAELAGTYNKQGRYEEAEKIFVEVLVLQRDVLGEKHPDTIWSMASLAATYHQQGRYEEAEKVKVEVLARQRDVLGKKHPDTLQAMHDFAVTWNSRQRCPEALDMMQEFLITLVIALLRSFLYINIIFTFLVHILILIIGRAPLHLITLSLIITSLHITFILVILVQTIFSFTTVLTELLLPNVIIVLVDYALVQRVLAIRKANTLTREPSYHGGKNCAIVRIELVIKRVRNPLSNLKAISNKSLYWWTLIKQPYGSPWDSCISWKRSVVVDEDRMQKKPLYYSPWKGTFYFIYNKHLFWFRSVEEKLGIRTEEVVTVSCFGSPTILKQFFNDCRGVYLKLTKNKTTIFEHRSGKWKRTSLKSIKPVSTVVINEEVKEELLRDIEGFLEPKAPTWHANRGIPYRKGYLLYGPPGTGKSSLCLSLAGCFDLDVYILNISAADGHSLGALFAELPSRCLLLLEDVDATGRNGNPRGSKSETTGAVAGELFSFSIMRPPAWAFRPSPPRTVILAVSYHTPDIFLTDSRPSRITQTPARMSSTFRRDMHRCETDEEKNW
ncbi:BCS1 N terminal-domain-containing protein [Podospora appendiculata]|uniref:BCS1 N terminal-domain-containing protein n=1 Tax=Podospora appendiculata TaxID=314037 RepID=A0AAE0X705_9PEZI|nr:BCS1 N terminal-domain-containing protein [Podospora appendiculata]